MNKLIFPYRILELYFHDIIQEILNILQPILDATINSDNSLTIPIQLGTIAVFLFTVF